MKVKFLFLSLIGMYDALSLSDELKALVNFDEWAQTSIENHNSISGKLPASIGVSHEDLPLVVYRLLKKSNTWASGHLLDLAQGRFFAQAYEMESRTLMLMSDLISLLTVKPARVERCLARLNNLSKKGAELSELISAWSWAVGSFKSSNSITNRINLDYQGTARAAQRLRAIRADLLTLLANAPINDRQNDAEKSENSVNHDEMVLSAQFDEAEGSTSGDWDVDVNQLISDNSNSRDIAIMVRHGLLDDMLQNTNVDLKSSKSKSLSATIIEPANDKRFPSRTLNKTEILEEDTPVASMEDVPTFDKLIMSHRNPRKPKLVTGENSNGTSSKSQWLTLSVVGSLAAIVLTVTLTVFARRIKSGKNNNSGTPVQKLRRFNLKNSPQSQQTVRRPQFTGYNAAYRPQSMDSGIDYSTNSSQISTSSGSSGPRRQHRPNNGHVVNFAHQPNGGHSQTTYPNRNRALPPPPYSRIQY